MYNHFAPEGKMGKKECSNYIEGVTSIGCSYHDGRVTNFINDYGIPK